MASKLRLSSLIPAGLVVECIAECEDTIVVTARGGGQEKACPLGGRASSRVHSRGQEDGAFLVVRRIFCEAPLCRRRILAERFEDSVVAERSRLTSRLEDIAHHVGLALGGRLAASLAMWLLVPVSNAPLLRVVRRRACSPAGPQVRQSSLEPWLPFLDPQWCRTPAAAEGPRLQRTAARGDEMGDAAPAGRTGVRSATERSTAGTVVRLMITARDHLSKADTVNIAAIEAAFPMQMEARGLIDRFHAVIRRQIAAAVRATITEPWSNGRTEGQITRLKLVKRQMYGARQDRSSAGTADQRSLIADIIEIASEPTLHAAAHARVRKT